MLTTYNYILIKLTIVCFKRKWRLLVLRVRFIKDASGFMLTEKQEVLV